MSNHNIAMQDLLLKMIRSAKLTTTANLNAQTAFEDLGLDSLAGVILSEELAEELHIQISPSVFWEYPTVEELAKHLDEQLSSDLASECRTP